MFYRKKKLRNCNEQSIFRQENSQNAGVEQ